MSANQFAKTAPRATMQDVATFVRARHHAWEHRNGLRPDPTPDEAIRTHSFTNLKRSLDRGTIDIQQWYDVMEANVGHVPFLACVARAVNDAAVLGGLDMALSPEYSAPEMARALKLRKDSGMPIKSTAYLASTNGHSEPWEEFYCKRVWQRLWTVRSQLAAKHDSLHQYCCMLMSHYGIGGFMAGQIIADLKVRTPWMKEARDYRIFFILGPGSTRGLKILGLKADTGVHHVQALANEILEYELDAPYRLDAQDAQNVLCEFDKWWRIKHGYGYRRKRKTEEKYEKVV